MEKKSGIDKGLREVFSVVILILFFGLFISILSNASNAACNNEDSNVDYNGSSNFTYTSPTTLTAEEGITSSSLQTLANGSALSFDGVNDWVNLGNNSLVGTDGNNFTVTGWIAPRGLNTTIHLPNYDLVNRYQNHTNGYRIWSFFINRYNSNKPFYWCMYKTSGPSCLSSNTLPQNNQWYFFAGTFTAGTNCTSIYINGVKDNATEEPCGIVLASNPSVNLTIGGEPGTADYTNGYMDEIRIYDRLLSSNEIVEINNSGRRKNNSINDTNLDSWYSLNENSGTIAYDVSGNSNHGTISGATWDNDGVLVSLVNGVDYTLNTATGVLTMSSDYLYEWISVSWTYFTNVAASGCNQIFSGIDTQFRIFAMAMIGFIGLIGTILGIRFLMKFVKPLISSRENNLSIVN